MVRVKNVGWGCVAAVALLSHGVGMATPADAGEAPAAAQATEQLAQAAPAPSPNAMVNLINLLVQRGSLSRQQGDELIREAEAEANTARAAQGAPAAAPAGVVAVPGAPPAPPPDGQIHVTYVPEIVKKQLRDEIKQEVLTEAKKENWAAPNAIPEWVSRINLYGDFRFRYEGDFFPSGNDNTGDFANFNAINTGSPFDFKNTVGNIGPQLDVDKNRDRFRIRARLGVDANLGEGFATGMRVATGETNTPVSQNQTLGAANNAQGGNFSNYAIWLDRGYLKYQPWNDDKGSFSVDIGRFDNPFFSTNLIWNDEIAFDGAAIQARKRISPTESLFLTTGAFPVFNTDFNFATDQGSKFTSEDKWLFAAQGGTDWAIDRNLNLKLGAAYYFFRHVEGRLSSPCKILSAADSCSTDDTRPSFAQKGNTYMQLRNIIPVAGDPSTGGNDNGTVNQFQYYGLATPFRVLALTGQLDFSHFDPVHITLNGEFVKNLAFNQSAIDQVAVNNRSGSFSLTTPPTGPFDGGDMGYFFNLTVGHQELQRLWDWSVSGGYKYLESDAVVDAFTDSDFGLGGTNLKGYILSGKLALSRNIWTRLRWMSADAIAGPPFSTDIIQLDLNAKF